MSNPAYRLWRKLRLLLGRDDFKQEMEEEIRFHLDMKARDNRKAGMSAIDAPWTARREFGDVNRVIEESRNTWGFVVLETVLQDLRYGLRSLGKSPGFTTVVVLTLALGIGANTAIFSIMHTVLFRPLPFEQGDDLVRVRDVITLSDGRPRLVSQSAHRFRFVEEQGRVFEGVGAQVYANFTLVGEGEPEQVMGARISAGALPVLGVEPLLGRRFRTEEDLPGAESHVALLGHDLWKRRFGGTDSVLGQAVKLNGESYTVIGVMPPFFTYPHHAEIWTPLALSLSDAAPGGGRNRIYTVARLRPGVTAEELQSELDTLAARLELANPEVDSGRSMTTVSVRADLVEDLQPRLLGYLLGASAFLLLIATINVANMLLARSLQQRHAIALQLALGAGRRRVVQQLLIQALVLSFLGGCLGLLLARLMIRPVMAMSPIAGMDMKAFFQSATVDYRILAFAFSVSLLVAVLLSLLPAARISTGSLQSVLKEDGRTTEGVRGRRLFNSLVVIEVAMAVVVLVGAGLMIQSLQRLRQVDLGFESENLLTLQLTWSEIRYPEDRDKVSKVDECLRRLLELPGVDRVGMTTKFPLDPARRVARFSVQDRPTLNSDEPLVTNHRVVSPGYFGTVGIPILEGRSFSRDDRAETQPVVVVSDTLARTIWPGEDPVGKRIKPGRFDSEQPWLSIVGVVGDVMDTGDFRMTWYRPATQESLPSGNVTVVIRAASDPLRLVKAIGAVVWQIDPEVPISKILTAEQLLAESLRETRFGTLLFVLFASLGLALAAVGIYGVLSFNVVQQTREMALRAALGARPNDILKQVLREGVALTMIGLGIGWIGVVILGRVLAGFLHEVKPTDPKTFVVVSLIALVVAVIASYLPALRATKADPVIALKSQ